MKKTTPGPWAVMPYETPPPHLRPLYPEGTYLVVGPPDDEGARHTVAVCLPCDDGTHPDRAAPDAFMIVAAFNARHAAAHRKRGDRS